MIKKYSLTPEFQEKIQTALESYGYSLSEPQKLAKCVLKLSDHYQQARQTTPWNDPECVAAQIAYYLPLNFVRNQKVFDEALSLQFPSSAEFFLDFGVGLGPTYQALKDSNWTPQKTIYAAMDQSQKALELFQKHFYGAPLPKWTPALAAKTCGAFSYSMNELTEPPSWFWSLSEILIVEPSTGDKGRKLMQLRAELMAKGYSIWAPCTHQEECPLLTHSKKDWCHDRVHWEQPVWFQQIEKHLPIKNNTLTFSYLLASKTPSPLKSRGRIVGDPLQEKGKVRWLYCQGTEREFLSWLHKQGPVPDLNRGELMLSPDFEKKGNELRWKAQNTSLSD